MKHLSALLLFLALFLACATPGLAQEPSSDTTTCEPAPLRLQFHSYETNHLDGSLLLQLGVTAQFEL